jgi:hypothetical protein
MGKTRSRKHKVKYSQRLGLTGTPSAPFVLRRNNDALIVEIECGGQQILTLTITGGGQLHLEDSNGRKHLSALEFVSENKKIKGHPY